MFRPTILFIYPKFNIITSRYFHAVFKGKINNTLCPLITTGCVILSIIASLSNLTTLEAYGEDIAAGWFLGICSAIYMVCHNIHFN